MRARLPRLVFVSSFQAVGAITALAAPIAYGLACGASTPSAVAPVPSSSASASVPASASVASSAVAAFEDPAPVGRLPRDVRPEAVRLDLSVVPSQPRFSGAIEIDVALAQARSVLWLHSKGHHVTRAEIKTKRGRRSRRRSRKRTPTASRRCAPRVPSPQVARRSTSSGTPSSVTSCAA
ncbi:MAG: hypothetical protein ACHREM_14875, partial [Polyangiales bacterium]